MGAVRICLFLCTLVLVTSKPIIIEQLKTIDDIGTNVVDEAISVVTEKNNVNNKNGSISLRNQIRPGIVINSYALELTPNPGAGIFAGRAVIQVSVVDQSTREDPIVLYARGLDVSSVVFSLLGGTALYNAAFSVDEDDGLLEIETDLAATLYTFYIEYTGSLTMTGKGLFYGSYNGIDYVAMNLHPTHARRVFPCMDEPTEVSIMSFSFNGLEYQHLISNSMLEDNSGNEFRALQGPPHVWGMIAHSFSGMNLAVNQVTFYVRPGVTGQDTQASGAISFYFTELNEWTGKPYSEIILNQDGRMNIVALPDISTDWHALSTVGIWEAHMYMEIAHSVKQRKIALYEIAKAMAKQWFGYVIYPENWRYEWVVSGLASYAAYEMMSMYQEPLTTDVTRLDVNTLFVSEIIQESLLRDAYAGVTPLEAASDLFEEGEIRDHVNGLLNYKAPALLRMMRIVLSDNPLEEDFVKSAARVLVTGRSLQTVNSLSFVDAINSYWMAEGNGRVGEFADYLETWITNTGYPILHVNLLQGGVLISQEHFGFVPQLVQDTFLIPITYTTSINPDFDNIVPVLITDVTRTISFFLDEEDWVLFNIQGQGYYRVNYDVPLWERIIEALEDPERREVIHPLNRATLVDDALNLARAGRLDYEFAFQVVLSMEHETEYAVWKAFVRNMDFLRKRLVALVTEDEDLDPDIYLRMVRRTIGSVENELGFYPDISLTEPAMETLTRGLVMDHACRANYQPCIAAAVDWFYDPNNNEVVNPNIPHEIRPAVYCTMVREGDDQVINALNERLAIEPTLYERVVILESLACSRDEAYIRLLLEQTIAVDGPFSAEESNRIFAAVAESSFENADIAMNFMSMRTMEIRNMYGGPEKLENLIYILSENMADGGLASEFRIWVSSQFNNLEDSQQAAERILLQVNQNLDWDAVHMDYVYEWIDENDAATTMLSLLALCMSVMVAIFNH